MVKLCKPLFCFLLLIFWAAAAAQAAEDYRPRVAVLPVVNETGENNYTPLCDTVSETIELILRLLGTYNVAGEEVWLGAEPDSQEGFTKFAAEFGLDEIIFGTMSTHEEGLFSFTISIYNVGDAEVKVTKEEVVYSILEVFDASDAVTVALLSEISDIHIGFGEIELIKTGGTGSYTVYLNDEKIRNPEKMLKKILNGQYTFRIRQDRVMGDTVILEENIEVFEDKVTTVTFAIPTATREERSFLQEKQAEVLEAAESAEDAQQCLEEVTRFQGYIANIDYDTGFAEESRIMADEVSSQAVEFLTAISLRADDKFYAKKPDLDTALQEYQYVSSLINDVYDISASEQSEEFSFIAPEIVQAYKNGNYIVIEVDRLYSMDSTGTPLKMFHFADELDLKNSEYGDVKIVRNRDIYYYHPELDSLLFLDQNLNRQAPLPIPGWDSSFVEAGMKLAVSPEGVFYLAGEGKVCVFTLEEERETNIEETMAAELESFGNPPVNDLFFDKYGVLNFFSGEKQQVFRFNALGEFISSAHLPEAAAESRCAIDSLGYYYISVPSQNSLVKYNPSGTLITRIGKYGSAVGEFSEPMGIFIHPETDILYVADSFNQRIQVFTPIAPPILFPEIAQIGLKFSHREETAEKTINRISFARKNNKDESPYKETIIQSILLQGYLQSTNSILQPR